MTPTGCGRGRRVPVLPFEVVAPSTAGTFLRSFTFGHVRQLDKAAELALVRGVVCGRRARRRRR